MSPLRYLVQPGPSLRDKIKVEDVNIHVQYEKGIYCKNFNINKTSAVSNPEHRAVYLTSYVPYIILFFFVIFQNKSSCM